MTNTKKIRRLLKVHISVMSWQIQLNLMPYPKGVSTANVVNVIELLLLLLSNMLVMPKCPGGCDNKLVNLLRLNYCHNCTLFSFKISSSTFGNHDLYITDHTSTALNGNTVICSFPYKKFFNIYFVQQIKTTNGIGKTGLPKCS